MTQYDLIHKIFEENKDKIGNSIKNSQYPETHKTLSLFHLKIEEFKSTFEALESNGSFYTSQCLSRILVEHFLVAYFIWTRCRIEKSDECAIDYVQYYAIYELIKQTNYNAKLKNSYDTRQTPLQNFLIKHPEFTKFSEPFTEEDFKDINTRANKFDIRRILNYIQVDLNENDHFKTLELPILEICEKYNKLSSFVHGGRTAELNTYENTPAIDKSAVLRENIDWALSFSQQLLSLQLVLLIDEDESLLEIYRPIYELINQK